MGRWIATQTRFVGKMQGEVRANADRLRHGQFGGVSVCSVEPGNSRGPVRTVPRQWCSQGSRADPNSVRLLHFTNGAGMVAATSTAVDNHLDQFVVGLDRRRVGCRNGDEFRVGGSD